MQIHNRCANLFRTCVGCLFLLSSLSCTTPTKELAFTSLEPNHGPTKGGLEVRLSGENLSHDAQVTFDGVAAEHLQVTETGLVLKLPARLGKAGLVDVEVSNPDGQSIRRTNSFRYELSAVSFAPQAITPALGTYPLALACGDVNGDGRLDLVSANFDSNSVSVLLGQGSRNFAAAVDYPIGAGARSVAVADFDGKNGLDVAAWQETAKQVGVLLNRGDGTFGAATQFPAGPKPYAGLAVDVNGDGKTDLVTSNLERNAVFVHLGKGDGTFFGSNSVGDNTYSYHGAAADLDLDGKVDLVVANYAVSGSIAVLIGDGTGSFAKASAFPTGKATAAVAVADVNQDGLPDVLAGNADSHNLSVMINVSQ